MSLLVLKDVVKRYHNHTAVDKISFEIPHGTIFGLLGPNGAGKTSLIRIITTITQADEGSIFINGEKLSASHIEVIGYLPEERGLYKKMKVGEQLMYLAQLKGMHAKKAKSEIMHWLNKFEITDWWNKRVEELSKGMQQKIQFISTVMHRPKLLILDEPFSGLDPINTNLIKEEISAINASGTSIIFSTHRMEQVEEICEQMVLVDNGKVILSGEVKDIKRSFKKNIYEFELENRGQNPLNFENYQVVESSQNHYYKIQLKEGQEANDILKYLIHNDAHIISFNEVLPSLNEIFIRTVENQN